MQGVIDSFYGPVFRPHGRPTARLVGLSCLGGVTVLGLQSQKTLKRLTPSGCGFSVLPTARKINTPPPSRPYPYLRNRWVDCIKIWAHRSASTTPRSSVPSAPLPLHRHGRFTPPTPTNRREVKNTCRRLRRHRSLSIAAVSSCRHPQRIAAAKKILVAYIDGATPFPSPRSLRAAAPNESPLRKKRSLPTSRHG